MTAAQKKASFFVKYIWPLLPLVTVLEDAGRGFKERGIQKLLQFAIRGSLRWEERQEAGNSTCSLKMKKSTTGGGYEGARLFGSSVAKARRVELNLQMGEDGGVGVTRDWTASRKAAIISACRSRRTPQEGSALEQRAPGGISGRSVRGPPRRRVSLRTPLSLLGPSLG